MLIQDCFRWLSLLIRTDSDAAAYYDIRGPNDVLFAHNGQPTMNMGYWRHVDVDAEDALWAATLALFQLVGESAELGPHDSAVLDAGCGFGTNAVYCMRTFAPARVIGLNLSRAQLRACQRQARANHMDDRVSFEFGSATAMPFADSTFDKIISIEAAFHFPLRRAFFREAHRVLKPGGVLAMVDLVAPRPVTVQQELLLSIVRRSVQMPKGNVYGLQEYCDALADTGFQILRADSIRDQVLVPYERWCRHRGLAAVLRFNPVLLLFGAGLFWYPWDYILFKLKKRAG
jgi:erythromycin 3''-O-methyltransferase